jgi:hypothetical protein
MTQDKRLPNHSNTGFALTTLLKHRRIYIKHKNRAAMRLLFAALNLTWNHKRYRAIKTATGVITEASSSATT